MKQSDPSGRSSDGVPSVTAEGEALPSDPRRIKYTATAAPAFGAHVQIARNVLWSRIPLPIDLNHINIWLIEIADGYLLVDTGMSASMCKDAWEQLEKTLDDRRPRALFVTHVHPDHIGLAAWLQERHALPVWMSARSHELAETVYGSRAPTSAEIESVLRAHGVAESTFLPAMYKPERFARMTTGLPRVDRYIEDTQSLESNAGHWRAIRTDGHADGHLCLWNESARILISGDQVLPTISSNISIMFQRPDADPLGDYLDSLERLRALPEDTLVLPSHGLPFYGLQHRIDDLRAHHEAQISKLRTACVTPLTACEALPVLFRRELAGMHFLLALGEAVAHLEYLAHRGTLERQVSAGVVRYKLRA
jgi:glyoxylase-like metal-dependent hydrolase (beta-lactamase superfamily II)